jgi:protein involved in polysaccharide export with SLBB domain
MMQVLAYAGGLSKLAAPKNTEIMRQNASGLYERVGAIDLKKLQNGKTEDRMLTAGDIVVVPPSGIKSYTQMAGLTAVYTAFSLLTRF